MTDPCATDEFRAALQKAVAGAFFDVAHDLEERAAVREYDGGAPREDAERAALGEVRRAWHMGDYPEAKAG